MRIYFKILDQKGQKKDKKRTKIIFLPEKKDKKRTKKGQKKDKKRTKKGQYLKNKYI